MARSSRQIKILELISKKEIDTQEELAAELQQAGFTVTQATISRDIKELGLVKVTTSDKRQKYAKEASGEANISNKLAGIFRHSVLSIDYAVNMVVIKTVAGGANTAGMLVDKLNIEGVLGCVAGDDTLFIVSKSEKIAVNLVEKLDEMINQ